MNEYERICQALTLIEELDEELAQLEATAEREDEARIEALLERRHRLLVAAGR